MVIYEVNAKGPPELRQEYGEMVRTHIDLLLKQEGFLKAECFVREPRDEELPPEFFLWTFHYHVENRAYLDRYIHGMGQKLRNEAKERFQGKVQVSRRILTSTPAAGLR